MPRFSDYFKNAGAGSPGRKAKGTDPRTELRKNAKPKILAFVQGGGGRKNFVEAPFNFDLIDRATATDSYIAQGLMRYHELMWKEGYDLKSADPAAMTYIQQRIRVIGLSQGQSFDRLVEEVGDNLIKYHNCFILKVRDPEVGRISGMNIKGLDGKDPIAGFFVIPTKTVKIAEDEYGRVSGYQQSVSGGSGKPITYKPEDVIHIRHMRMSGTQWGVPFLDAALEDIRTFRTIEEDMANVVHSEVYPLLHYAVNGKQPEWNVDPADIQAAYDELLQMKDNGAIVTKGADELEIMGSEGKALDVTPYINHFKERAIVGLGMNPAQIGVSTGANGTSAERFDAAMYDKIKTYQAVLEDMINNELFFELLIEGGFDPITAQRTGKADPGVRFEFKEIDVDAQIKRQNHTSVLWLQNMIKHDEMREKIGEIVDDAHFEEYHIDMVEVPLAEISKAQTGPDGGASPSSPAKGTSGSKNNPANQKGNRGGPKMATSWEELAMMVEARAVRGEWQEAYSAVKEFYVNSGAQSADRRASEIITLLSRIEQHITSRTETINQVRGIFKALAAREEMLARRQSS